MALCAIDLGPNHRFRAAVHWDIEAADDAGRQGFGTTNIKALKLRGAIAVIYHTREQCGRDGAGPIKVLCDMS